MAPRGRAAWKTDLPADRVASAGPRGGLPARTTPSAPQGVAAAEAWQPAIRLSRIEKTTVSRICPVHVRVSRRSTPSLTAPNFATAAWAALIADVRP